MKKLLALTVITCLLFAWKAPSQAYSAGELTFAIGYLGSVARGESISVPIYVSNNTGFAAVGLELTYDPNVFEIRRVYDPISAMPLNNQHQMTANPGTQWINLVNDNTDNWTGNGVVAEVTFDVKPGARLGQSDVKIRFTRNPDGTPVDSSLVKIADAVTSSGSADIVESINIGLPPPPEPSPGNNNSADSRTYGSQSPRVYESVPPVTYFEPVPEYTAPEPSYTNPGSFIGPDFVVYPEPEPVGQTSSVQSFGKIPQTGIAEPAELAAAAGLSFLVCASVCVYMFLSKHA